MDKTQILDAATTLAYTYGIDRVFKRHIAAHLKCAMGSINHHWGTMAALRNAVIKRAKTAGDAELSRVTAGRLLRT